MIRQHGDQSKVLRSGLRALGTLVYCEDNIGIIVGEGATKAIIDGMSKNQDNEETVQEEASRRLGGGTKEKSQNRD